MALKSKLLGGDPELEACAVHDSAHVMQGASGAHVGKIQEALWRLDRLVIDWGELSAKQYGPSTADAVLKFKTKRHIINFSYQTTEDAIVGKMTIDALDREMDALEKKIAAGKAAAAAPVGKRPLDFVVVWFNMFIPKSIPGLTIPHARVPGMTVIVDVESGLFGVTFKKAIETNERSFDSSFSCSSLMRSFVTVDWGVSPPNVYQRHSGDFVRHVDPATHVRIGTRHLSNTAKGFDPYKLNASVANFSVWLSVSDPFGFPLGLLGTMDVEGDLQIDRAARAVAFKGKVDYFPAFEAYASSVAGAASPKALFTQAVPLGKKPSDQIGPPTSPVHGTALF